MTKSKLCLPFDKENVVNQRLDSITVSCTIHAQLLHQYHVHSYSTINPFKLELDPWYEYTEIERKGKLLRQMLLAAAAGDIQASLKD